jgi:hypothetical protein
MNSKLTLELDSAVLDSAKEYADSQNIELIDLISQFINRLPNQESTTHSKGSIVKQLSGIISQSDLDKLSKSDPRAKYIIDHN